jgi:hypothetical protein
MRVNDRNEFETAHARKNEHARVSNPRSTEVVNGLIYVRIVRIRPLGHHGSLWFPVVTTLLCVLN